MESINTSEISDGYHTFGELYEFRSLLFIAVLQAYPQYAWRALRNSDGEKWEGWFLAGIFPEEGKQITFHLPDKFWKALSEVAETYDVNPYFDGHASEEVMDRLSQLIFWGK